MDMRQRLNWSAIALAGLAFLAACGPAKAPQSAVRANELHRGNGADPDTLDPQKTSTVYELNILNDLFEGLMAMDASGQPIYGAAISHMVSSDGLVWTFKLRDTAWSDGVPVTADDFVFSFRRILNPKTAAKYASLIYPIKNAQGVNEGKLPVEAVGVKALDAKTVEITLERPTPYLPTLLTHTTCQPVPKHLIEKVGDAWAKPGTMVTNGPYVPAEWVPNTRIKVVKNPHYYDAANVHIDAVVFLPIGDEAIELQRYRAGEIDYTDSLPARALPALRQEFGAAVHVHSTFDSHYLIINVRKAPFNDPRVREALSLAVDREVIANQILNAGQLPAYSFVPPEMANYTARGELKFKGEAMDARRARAIALLKAAGFSAAHPLHLTYRYRTSIDSGRIAVAIQSMWKQIGVNAELLNSEGKVHFNALRTQDYEIAHAEWVADYNDAENYLFLFMSTSGQMNYTKYSNPKYDALMKQAAITLDIPARAKILQSAEQMMLDDNPVIPMYFAATRHLVRPTLSGFTDNVLDYHRSRFMQFAQ